MMSFLDYFKGKRKPTASVAKERLQIILAREHPKGSVEPDYLPALKKEILEVVSKYVAIDPSAIQVNVERDDNCEILELNIALPEYQKKSAAGKKEFVTTD